MKCWSNTRKSLTEIAIKIPHGNLGRKHSPETIEKIRMARLGPILVPDHLTTDYKILQRKGFLKVEALKILGLTK